MLGKNLIMQTLLGGGSGGGSSGGGGGGSAAVSPKEVNFYDYDGTCVHAYTVAEAQALSELPAGPEHPGLVFQGWNWSLGAVRSLTRAMNIGAMYTTDDGTTRLYITLQEGRTSPMLGVGVNGTVTVDWGDGTEPDVLTGTSVGTTKWTSNHAYTAPGDYVIRLTVDGKMELNGDSSTLSGSRILRRVTGSDNSNRAYQNALKRIEIGDHVNVGDNAFYDCYSLESVSTPHGLLSFGRNAFMYCHSLKSITIPNGVTTIGSDILGNCSVLKSVAIPNSVTSVSYFIASCYCITSVTIPAGVTTISPEMFYLCHNLTNITIHGDIKSIGKSAFMNCYSAAWYDFTACTAVPTLSNSNAFSGIPADCEIRVPAALYDEWVAATNWAAYAANIKAY